LFIDNKKWLKISIDLEMKFYCLLNMLPFLIKIMLVLRHCVLIESFLYNHLIAIIFAYFNCKNNCYNCFVTNPFFPHLSSLSYTCGRLEEGRGRQYQTTMYARLNESILQIQSETKSVRQKHRHETSMRRGMRPERKYNEILLNTDNITKFRMIGVGLVITM